MKKLLSFALALFVAMALAVPALAVEDIQSKALVSNSAVSVTSVATATGLRTKKTIFITGQTSATAFSNYSGVVTVEEAYAAGGPWVPAKDRSGNVVTATHTNAIFHIDSLATYIRAVVAKTNEAAEKHIGVFLKYAQ